MCKHGSPLTTHFRRTEAQERSAERTRRRAENGYLARKAVRFRTLHIALCKMVGITSPTNRVHPNGLVVAEPEGNVAPPSVFFVPRTPVVQAALDHVEKKKEPPVTRMPLHMAAPSGAVAIVDRHAFDSTCL